MALKFISLDFIIMIRLISEKLETFKVFSWYYVKLTHVYTILGYEMVNIFIVGGGTNIQEICFYFRFFEMLNQPMGWTVKEN